jgi:hypothetical protein
MAKEKAVEKVEKEVKVEEAKQESIINKSGNCKIEEK